MKQQPQGAAATAGLRAWIFSTCAGWTLVKSCKAAGAAAQTQMRQQLYEAAGKYETEICSNRRQQRQRAKSLQHNTEGGAAGRRAEDLVGAFDDMSLMSRTAFRFE
jgi:hypothetical protein